MLNKALHRSSAPQIDKAVPHGMLVWGVEKCGKGEQNKKNCQTAALLIVVGWVEKQSYARFDSTPNSWVDVVRSIRLHSLQIEYCSSGRGGS